MSKKCRKREKERLPRVPLVFHEDKSDDLAAALLQSLSRLAPGGLAELSDHRWPPKSILKWIDKADLPRTNGLLLATLYRWHELRREA